MAGWGLGSETGVLTLQEACPRNGVIILFPWAGPHLPGCPEVSLVLLEASGRTQGPLCSWGSRGWAGCWPPLSFLEVSALQT